MRIFAALSYVKYHTFMVIRAGATRVRVVAIPIDDRVLIRPQGLDSTK